MRPTLYRSYARAHRTFVKTSDLSSALLSKVEIRLGRSWSKLLRCQIGSKPPHLLIALAQNAQGSAITASDGATELSVMLEWHKLNELDEKLVEVHYDMAGNENAIAV